MSKKDIKLLPKIIWERTSEPKKLVQDTEWNGVAFIMAIGWTLVMMILFVASLVKH